MINKPVLARCDNREIKAKKHPSSGNPEEWLDNSYLVAHGLRGVSFDFFVNWEKLSISNELWIKRIVRNEVKPWPVMQSDTILKSIYQCDGEDAVRTLCKFAHNYNFSCHYFLFKESQDWALHPSPIVEVRLDEIGSVQDLQNITIPELKSRIKQLSGGQVFVGKKGLFWGLTSLECFLSKTDAAWPSDADLVLVNSNLETFAIIEFKKHTLNTPIEKQALSNYYPYPDGRKYNRLAILKSYFGMGSTDPIIIIYYPTRQDVDTVKIEHIEGQAQNLKATWSEIANIPNVSIKKSCQEFTNLLIETIKAQG